MRKLKLVFKASEVILLTCIISVLAGLVALIPIFIAIWIFADSTIAWSYSAYVALICGSAYILLEYFSGKHDTFDEEFQTLRLPIVVPIALIGFVCWFKLYYIEVVVNQAEIAERIAKQEAYKPREELCRDIGVRYGRASAKAMQGQAVRASEDVFVPDRCRNDPSTAKGIEIGARLQSKGG